ncbi:MAG: vWA domain-containing protein [Actinomycetota bacterium]
MAESSKRPGTGLATRPLHFIWIADTSGSMASDGKIQSLNHAIRETIPHLRDVAFNHPFARLLIRCVSFSTEVAWHVAEPTPVERLNWRDLGASGYTNMGSALKQVAAQLRVPPMEPRSLPPSLVLISDGQPTDDFQAGLEELMNEPWGAKAIRLAVAIGRDADTQVLNDFIGNPEFRPVTANNPEQLVASLRWASVVASRMASQPARSAASTPISVPDERGDEAEW